MTQIAAQRSFTLPTGKLNIHVDPGLWSFDDCMDVGARHNPKRGFLFVSKVLGKHIPVRPSVMRLTHEQLAKPLAEKLKDVPTLFIAMAETATGLGHGVFDAALSLCLDHQPWVFATTTRYKIKDCERIDFTEDHSHATDQWLHLPSDTAALDEIKAIVLIDDEISTGKTLRNLEKSVRKKLPNVEIVQWVTLTCLAQSTSKPCEFLLRGGYDFEPGDLGKMPAGATGNGQCVSDKLSRRWGRSGLTGIQTLGPDCQKLLSLHAKNWRSGDKPFLALGQGEFMHPSFVAGQWLEERGAQAFVQSSTRSPIMLYGAIKQVLTVPDPLGTNVNHYVYNLDPGDYKTIFVIAEPGALDEAEELANQLGNAVVVCPDF